MNEKEHQLHRKLVRERGAYWRPYQYAFAINPYKSSLTHDVQRTVAHIIRPGFYEFQVYDYIHPGARYTPWTRSRRPRSLPRTPENLREITLCGLLSVEPVEIDAVSGLCRTCYKADISMEEKILKRLASMAREKKPPQRDARGRFAPKPAL